MVRRGTLLPQAGQAAKLDPPTRRCMHAGTGARLQSSMHPAPGHGWMRDGGCAGCVDARAAEWRAGAVCPGSAPAPGCCLFSPSPFTS